MLPTGTVQCWGRNAEHELGTGTGTPSLSPITVPGLSGVQAVRGGVTRGRGHCAEDSAETWHCWGFKPSGCLGTDPVLFFGPTVIAR